MDIECFEFKVHMQFRKMFPVSAYDFQFVVLTIFQLKTSVERRVAVSEAHEGKKLFHNRSLQFCFNFLDGVIMAVDISPNLCFFQKF